MPNKTRFVIDPDRIYVVKLDDGDEIEVTGLEIVTMGYSVRRNRMIIDALKDWELDEETGRGWF
jgi:hypothetical protein